MRSEFPLNQKHTQLGIIPDPVISIPVLTKYGYQKFDFLVDTGADCSIMPVSVAEDLGINVCNLPKMHFSGIEGGTIDGYISKITVKITDAPIEITCALSINKKCPFILGRKDIFSKFSIMFDNKNKNIKFISIYSP